MVLLAKSLATHRQSPFYTVGNRRTTGEAGPFICSVNQLDTVPVWFESTTNLQITRDAAVLSKLLVASTVIYHKESQECSSCL